MKKKIPLALVALVAFILALLSLSKRETDPLRLYTVSLLSPAWKVASSVQSYLKDRPLGSSLKGNSQKQRELELENRELKERLATLTLWQEKERGKTYFETLLKKEYFSTPAKVIYRDPSAWGSSLWINVGEEENERFQEKRIERNSPVVLGGSLVGVVDYVGKHHSRIRLITDSAVSPAVRVARGKVQNDHAISCIHRLKTMLEKQNTLFVSEQEKKEYLQTLFILEKKLSQEEKTVFLAKGELHGSAFPLWRARRSILKGIGFNFEFPDLKGPLQTKREENIPILQEGDLLITSGLDGLFPPGLLVATVSYVEPTQNGAFAYEIEALPTAFEMNELDLLFVLPSIRQD